MRAEKMSDEEILSRHLKEVSELAAQIVHSDAAEINKLAALMHDIGKKYDTFGRYLLKTTKSGKIPSREEIVRIMSIGARRPPETDDTESATPDDEEHTTRSKKAERRASERGLAVKAALAQRPDMLTAEQFADRVNTTEVEAVRLAEGGQFFTIDAGIAGQRYPAVQLEGDRPLPGLDRVIAAAGGRNWRLYEMLSQPQPELSGRTAARALLDGDGDEVVAIFEGYGDSSA